MSDYLFCDEIDAVVNWMNMTDIYETLDCNNDEGRKKGGKDSDEICGKKTEVDHDEEDEVINNDEVIDDEIIDDEVIYNDESCFGSDMGFNNDSVLNGADFNALSKFANDVSPEAKRFLFEMVELEQQQQQIQQQLLEELIKNQRFQDSYAATAEAALVQEESINCCHVAAPSTLLKPMDTLEQSYYTPVIADPASSG